MNSLCDISKTEWSPPQSLISFNDSRIQYYGNWDTVKTDENKNLVPDAAGFARFANLTSSATGLNFIFKGIDFWVMLTELYSLTSIQVPP
jgi:hypothetical protein